MSRKKPEPIRELHHPDGRIEVQYLDGTSKFIDPQNPDDIPTLAEVDQLLADLKKDPKSRLLRDAARVYLAKMKEAEFDKTTAKEWYDKIAELAGAQLPSIASSQIVQINICMPDSPPARVIDMKKEEGQRD